MSLKKVIKNQGELNPVKHVKNAASIVKRDIQHKPDEIDTSAQEAALEQQRLQQAELDEEENRRRKRLFAASAGIRAFRGSALFRRSPSDTAGTAPAASTSRATSTFRSGSAPRRAGGDGRSLIP